MSVFGITGVTVSVEIGNKDYGSGQNAFMSVSSRLPEGVAPLQLDSDAVVNDGLEKYFMAWDTLLQGMLATGVISGSEFKQRLASALLRHQKVTLLYQRIKNMNTDELSELLPKKEESTNG